MKVNPSGPATANIVVLTDMPESGDVTGGNRVLSSKQGYLFGQMVSEAGGNANAMYKTACTFEVLDIPIKSKSALQIAKFVGDHARDREQIKQELQCVNPNVIITLGEYPLQALTGNSGVRRFQGSVLSLAPQFDLPNIKVIPIQHPRDIYKVYSAFYYTPVYIRKALALKDIVPPYREKLHIEIATNYNTLRNYLRENYTSPYMVSDIETYYNMISCIGISLASDSAVVVPLLENLIQPDELGEMLKLLQKAFRHFPYVNQNVLFDHVRLERFGFEVPNILGDTMLNQSILYPELPKNLGFINSLFTDIPYFKDEGKGYTPSKQLYMYCGKDCISTYQIYAKQMTELKEIGMADFVKNRVMKYYPVYKNLQERGIQVDGIVRQNLIEKYETMLLVLRGEIKEITGRDFNPLSPKQCNELLYEELGLPAQKKRRADNTYTETADEDAIDYLLLNHVNNDVIRELLQKIVCTRKVVKILNYLNIPLHPGDIFHTSYNLAGTETGRTSTNKSGDRWYYADEKGLQFKELGFALQTIPKHGFELVDGSRIGQDIRTMFVPRSGYVFAEGDQSKAEAVIVTVLAEDWDLYSVFYSVNLHKVTAVAVFNLTSVDQVTHDQYNIGKRVRHAANYDMQAATLAKQVMCPIDTAKRLLAAFREKNWKIPGIFHRSIREFLQKNLWLNTPYGRRRDFFVNPRDNNYLREGYAYIPQSTVAEKTKIAMVETSERIQSIGLDAHFLGESHDSVLAEVKRGQEVEYLAILKENMEKPIDMRKCCIPRNIDCVIRFECSVGENWKDLKEVDIS